jgi:hypothetical protein
MQKNEKNRLTNRIKKIYIIYIVLDYESRKKIEIKKKIEKNEKKQLTVTDFFIYYIYSRRLQK